MQPGSAGHSLYGPHGASRASEAEHEAREYRSAVYQERTCSTFPEFASMLGAGQSKIFAENLEQGLVRCKGDFGVFAVELE